MENNKLKEMVKKALTKPLKEQDVEARADRIGGEMELSKMMNLLDEFESALESHDWSYMMSDDKRAYEKGSAEEKELEVIGAQLYNSEYNKEAEELYKSKNVKYNIENGYSSLVVYKKSTRLAVANGIILAITRHFEDPLERTSTIIFCFINSSIKFIKSSWDSDCNITSISPECSAPRR